MMKESRVWFEAADALFSSGPGSRLLEFARKGTRVNASGLPDPAKSFLVAALTGEVNIKSCVLVPDEARARALHEELSAFLDPEDLLVFHSREYSLVDVHAAGRELEQERTAVMSRLLAQDYSVLIVTAAASLQRLRAPGLFRSLGFSLKAGEEKDPDELEGRLVLAGYERIPQIETPGQFARRGDILDIWPPGASLALRVSFFDILIDELKNLNPDTQRSVDNLAEYWVPPARELPLLGHEWEETAGRVREYSESYFIQAGKAGLKADAIERLKKGVGRDSERLSQSIYFPSLDRWLPLFESSETTILDYLSRDECFFFLDEPLTFSRRLDAAHAGFLSRLTASLERGETVPLAEEVHLPPFHVMRSLDQAGSIMALVDLPSSGNGLPGAHEVTFRARLSDSYRNNPDRLAQELARMGGRGGTALLFAGSSDRAEQLSLFLAEKNLYSAIVLTGNLPRGFVLQDEGLFMAGVRDLFGVSRTRRRTRGRQGREVFFRGLTPGSLVVHEDYGIGEFRGTETITTSDGERDYLTLVYRDGTLHLPVDRVELLSPYIPAGDAKPKISRLGGTEWNRQKERARNSIKRLVTDITALYAERRAIRGHVYASDTPWQREFESSFPYEETEDQLKAVEEIKSDMESDKVMDRLICGDVGFGKTEVSFRALFKCVMEGKQAALLAPTTVLVRQHYNNLLERLEGFPVTARQLSRFVPEDQQKETIRDLARGQVDIVLGTHRLLSKDIKFKDLGLLVVDEEQRFGVDHKEMIKALAPSIEVISLSATPIPRTLHLSLSGIRDISLLEEGPQDRRPVQTAVMEYSEDLVIDAILREQARQGQVFYLYNNTHKIDGKAADLAEKMPGVRFAVAHAKLSERRLEEVIEAFVDGAYDVLVCTTIIESGIDMPRVNTLIVEDADRFGLSQLYQLRGRVGRSDRQAYALITYRPDRVIGEAAQKRLTAIRDFTELGSGFQIALRDLEVRGAGNLLGAEQSGHLAAIGYDLYTKMLGEAVALEQGNLKPEKKVKTVVDLPVDAVLPLSYVRESSERLELYRRIASIVTIDDYRDVYDELLDRYGEPPEATLALLDISYIRAFGERAGFARIRANGEDIELLLAGEAADSMDLISRVMASETSDHPLTLKAGYRPLILVAGAAKKTSGTPGILRDLFAGADKSH